MQFHQARRSERHMHKSLHQNTNLTGILRMVGHSVLGRHLCREDNPIQGHGSQVPRAPLV